MKEDGGLRPLDPVLRSADDAGGTPVGGPGGETPWPFSQVMLLND
jgi:hypothetical protein